MSTGAAVAIGVFDGVHIGHQALLNETVTAARELGAVPAVLTFDPHPACIVAPERAPRLLFSLEERKRLLKVYGIERVMVVPFTLELSRSTPEQFVRELLCQRLEARVVIVGGNFRFGHKQAGGVGTLERWGELLGFVIRAVPAISFRGVTASSSEVRKRIEDGDVSFAARLLGRPFALHGSVIAGHGIGSKQTVPTLNLATQAEVLPARGVYITRTRELDTRRNWESITNVGVRPTFGGDEAISIETFLLSKLEGPTPARIHVDFLHRVREERKFPTVEELKAQILRDAKRAQVYHARAKRWMGIKV